MDDGQRMAVGLRERLEKHMDDLPVLPVVVMQLMGLDASSDDYFEKLVSIIEADPNFSARVLAAANSAASAPLKPITTIHVALGRLGSSAAAHVVLAFAVSRLFIPRSPWEKSLWRHAVQVALAAKALARHARDPEIKPDEAYVCGLLHDVGRFIMFVEAPSLLQSLDEGNLESPDALVAAERQIAGLTHPELGAVACERWKLPSLLRTVVKHHHEAAPPGLTARDAKVTAIVHFADLAMFPSATPGESPLAASDVASMQKLAALLPKFLRISAPDLRVLLVECERDAEATCVTLGIA